MKFQPENYFFGLQSATDDPMVRITESIHYLVQQHLTGNDVISAIEVSKQWHNFTVCSSMAMKKIVLNFVVESRFRPTPHDLQMILDSPRCYSSLQFSCRPDTNIVSRAKVLTEFASMLTYLKVDRIHWEIQMEPVSYDRLKSLEIGPDVSPEMVDVLFQSIRHSQLQVLSFYNHSISGVVVDFIKTQHQLKEISFINSKAIFELDDISFLCDLQMTKLKLGKMFWDDLQVESFKSNVLQLLTSQADTLKYFGIGCYDPDIMKMVMSLKNVKCLDIRVYSMFQIETFSINESIECAKFDTNNCVASDFIEFLKVMPNLSRIYHNTMTTEKLLVVVENVTGLQEILYTSNHWYDKIKKSYEAMKNSEDQDINRNIKLTKVGSDFDFPI